MAVSSANRLPLDWPCLGLWVTLTTVLLADAGEARGRQEAFVTGQPEEQGATNSSTVVNIDPPAKNEGLISARQQISREREETLAEGGAHVWSQGLELGSPLCVAQGRKSRCSSSHFPS